MDSRPTPPNISTLPSTMAKLKTSEERSYEPLSTIGVRDIQKLEISHIGWLRRRHEISSNQRVSGFVNQLSHNFKQKMFTNFQWRLRYVVLYNGCVYYYSKETSSKPNGAFSLESYKRIARATEMQSDDALWVFKVIPRNKTDKTWYFSAGSQRELLLWMACIKAEMERVFGKDNKHTDRLISNITNRKAFPSSSGEDNDSLYGVLEEAVYTDGTSEDTDAEDDYLEPGEDFSADDDSDHDPNAVYDEIPEEPEDSRKFFGRPLPTPPQATASLPGHSRSREWQQPEPERMSHAKPALHSRPALPLPSKPSPVNNKPWMVTRRSQSEEQQTFTEKEQERSSKSYRDPPLSNPGKPTGGPPTGMKILPGQLDKSKLNKIKSQLEMTTPKNFPGDARKKSPIPPPNPRSPDRQVAKPGRRPSEEFDVLPESVYYDFSDRNIEQLLMKHRVNGMYALRNSAEAGKKVLVVWLEKDGRCKNYKIFTQKVNQYSLGPNNDASFQNIRELIQYYYRNSLPTASGQMLARPYPGDL